MTEVIHQNSKLPSSASSSTANVDGSLVNGNQKPSQGGIKKEILSKKPSSPSKTSPTPKNATSPLSPDAKHSEGKKIPPIKAPVGLAPNPNPKAAKSKIGSMQNIKHKPGGGKVKVETKKLEFGGKAKSKVGSTDNLKHKPGGGEKKMQSQKLDWKGQSKVGSLDNSSHKPGGGQKKIASKKIDFKASASSKVGSRDNLKHSPGVSEVKIESHKLDFKEKASSKVGSMDNIKHVPAGGDVKIYDEKIEFKDRASSRISSLPSTGSTGRSSQNQSPVPTSPQPETQTTPEKTPPGSASSTQSSVANTKAEEVPEKITENSSSTSSTPKLPPIDLTSPAPNSVTGGAQNLSGESSITASANSLITT